MRDIWHVLVGPPLPTQRMAEMRLNNFRALAALSPDALASIAYANQEIFLGLVAAGAAGLAYSWSIALAIAALLGIVALSYSQTIVAYPAGGGSYTVARENLGVDAGLVAAAALLIAYVLNVAVSMTAGVAAVASVFPALWPHRTLLALLLLALITVANLRGLREASTVTAVPVYLFVIVYLGMIAVGVVRAVVEGPGALAPTALPAAEPVTLYLILHTFSTGCTAMTGIEAISNGVPVFKPPESRNANRTMAAMAALMVILFLGTTGLTQYFAVAAGPEETILAALARRVFGAGPFFFLVQASTLLVLMVAANTSFMGFPRLASIAARDGYMPRQLTMLGERLVFSNGILLLTGAAGVLIVLFGGDTHALIPLFATGTFLAFTLSQAGMVVRWLKVRGAAWRLKTALNLLGVVATCVALIVIGVSNFLGGAWLVILLIAGLVFGFHKIRQHYRAVAEQLSLEGLSPSLAALPAPRVILPISGVHRGVIEAVRYARSISKHVTAVYVEVEPGSAERVRRRWEEWGLDQDATLAVVPSPYRSVVGPLLAFIDQADGACDDGQLATILLPEFVPARWWQTLLHNQTAWLLKVALLYRRRAFGRTRAIIDVPFHLKK
ncbi:MAG: APC family permease [Anaerolineae bacterium]|nr:APC family permease [Anaerolineae bacterium]